MFPWINNNRLVKGILIGVGISAAGFLLYKNNEEKVDNFLRRNGIQVKTPAGSLDSLSVEELMRTRERIEDLIAEKELDEQRVVVAAPEKAK